MFEGSGSDKASGSKATTTMNRRWYHHYDGTSYCHYVQRCVNGSAAPSPSSRGPLPSAPDTWLTLPLPRGPIHQLITYSNFTTSDVLSL